MESEFDETASTVATEHCSTPQPKDAPYKNEYHESNTPNALMWLSDEFVD
jgi:hypothetical protein